jgi:hypothetical protein
VCKYMPQLPLACASNPKKGRGWMVMLLTHSSRFSSGSPGYAGILWRWHGAKKRTVATVDLAHLKKSCSPPSLIMFGPGRL